MNNLNIKKFLYSVFLLLPILVLFIFPSFVLDSDYHIKLVIALALLNILYIKRLNYYINKNIIILALFIFILFLNSYFISENYLISYNELYKVLIYFFGLIILNLIEKEYLIYILIFIFFITSFEGIYQRYFGFDKAIQYLNKTEKIILETELDIKNKNQKDNDKVRAKPNNTVSRNSLKHNSNSDLILNESVSMNKIEIKKALNRLKSKRIFSIFILPNAYAGYLIMMIPFFHYLSTKNKKWYILFFLGFFLLYLTKSIAALLSLVTAYFLFFKNKKFFLLLFIIILSLILLIVYVRGYKFIKESVKDHLYNNFISYKIFKDNFFKGVGFGDYRFYYPKYFVSGANEIRYAHNLYFQILVETGIFGALFLLFLIYLYFKNIIKYFNNESKFFLISIFTFLIHNMFDMSFYIVNVTIIFIFMNRLYFDDEFELAQG